MCVLRNVQLLSLKEENREIQVANDQLLKWKEGNPMRIPELDNVLHHNLKEGNPLTTLVDSALVVEVVADRAHRDAEEINVNKLSLRSCYQQVGGTTF